MPVLKALQFNDHLKDGQLKPVYALIGEDEELVAICVSALKSAVERPDLPGSITRDLAEEPDPRDVLDELCTQPFMGMKGLRLVIVRKGTEFLASHGDHIKQYLDAPARSGILVLCCEDRKRKRKDQGEPKPRNAEEPEQSEKERRLRAQRTKAGMEAITLVGLVVDCGRLSWQAARDWLSSEARKLGKTLTPRAVWVLVESVGPNLVAIRNELEKLATFRANDAVISESDVEELVPESRARSIFELSTALTHSDVAKALQIGENLLLRGERPEGIVAFLGRQTRTLWQVKRLVRSGKAVADLERELHLPDFAARNAAEGVRKLDDAWFARQLKILAAADVELKTRSVQSRDQSVWLASLLAELCSSPSSRK